VYKSTGRWMIRRTVRALAQGDVAPLLSAGADAVLEIPGETSWSGRHRGTAAIEAFLRRFVDAGLTGEVDEILVNGPPWRTGVCVVFTDRATDETGAVVYESHRC